jgi:DNA-binding transcriptional ArsR family regulator
MVSDDRSIHKILNEGTNRKILALIDENSGLSYTDLMEKLEVISEGLLNYHLKTLDKLLSQNDENQYVLTEKGKFALKFLEEFPKQEILKRKRAKQLWFKLGVGNTVLFIVTLILYYQDYIILRYLYLAAGIFIGMTVIICLGYWTEVNPLTAERSKKEYAVFYIFVGGTAGLISISFGTTIASVISVFVGGPNLLQLVSSNNVFFFSYISSAIVIGCITGYCIGKKEGFKKLNGPKWLTNRL